ncbi:MAG: hydroxymethylglutaryl-CoA lyase [Acidobacteriota bacterium]|nr:hydroxymethylglutaryl-CoA lyase [Acidobacteriota bacterium]
MDIEITDVAPRDGLQNEQKFVTTENKLKLIAKLVTAGIRSIQATSFVNPARVPALADAEQVVEGLEQFPHCTFSALIANQKGYERARRAGISHLHFIISASEEGNRHNVNRSQADSLAVFAEIAKQSQHEAISLEVGIARSFHCPFAGTTSVRTVAEIAQAVRRFGDFPISLGDADGMAFPNQVAEAIKVFEGDVGIPAHSIKLHFHDTYGRALANVLTGLTLGVRKFDAAVGGLGGCPFCPGSSGNLATEDLVNFLEGQGYSTGIEMEKLLDAAEFAVQFSSRTYQGHLLRAMRPKTLTCH